MYILGQVVLNNYLPNVAQRLPDFGQALKETLVMVAWSGIICFILGLTLGVQIGRASCRERV